MTLAIIDREFEAPEDTIRRAEQKLANMHAGIQRFFADNSASMVIEFDPQTTQNIKKVQFSSAIPNELIWEAREALQHARHSFDQTTFAARNIVAKRTAKSVYFPWSENPADLKRLLLSRIPPDLWDVFKSHKPYPASDAHPEGDTLIRNLATAANKKHTVGLTIQGHINQRFVFNGGKIASLSFDIPRWDSVKNEAVLMRWPAGEPEPQGDHQIAFAICLDDPALAQPVEAHAALQKFTAKAKSVCESVKARCIELRG